MRKTGPAPLIDERYFIPANLDEARQLYEALVAKGTSHGLARGIMAWLVTLPEDRADDPATDVTRSRYRQQLHKLGKPPWGGGKPSEYMGAYISPTARYQGRNRRGQARTIRLGRPVALIGKAA